MIKHIVVFVLAIVAATVAALLLPSPALRGILLTIGGTVGVVLVVVAVVRLVWGR